MSCPSAVAPTAPSSLPMTIPWPQTCVTSSPEGRRTTPDTGYEVTPDTGYETELEACLLLVVKAAGSSPLTVSLALKVSPLLTTDRGMNSKMEGVQA